MFDITEYFNEFMRAAIIQAKMLSAEQKQNPFTKIISENGVCAVVANN